MEIFVVLHHSLNETGGVTAADNGGGAGFFADELGGDRGSGRVGGIFGIAEGTIPDNSRSVGDEICEFGGGEWADV